MILRPHPGAAATAAKARGLGMQAVVAPLFTVEPLPWVPPDPAGFDALLLTSANAPRHAGSELARFTHLPCFAVGETSARAARAAGFRNIRCGPRDAGALLEMAAEGGCARLLHLAGREHLPIQHPKLRIERRLVYDAKAAPGLPAAAAKALRDGAVVLVHSPRAAAILDGLATQAKIGREGARLAVISQAAAEAAGTGWKSVHVAAEPRDHALLELAAKLCQAARVEAGNK